MRVVERMRPLLGTFVSVRAAAPDRASRGELEAAIASAFAAVTRVNRLMSTQDAASDVSRINRAKPAEPIRVDRWTLEVLRRAREIWAATRGLFDCCAAPGSDARFTDLELLPDALRLRRRIRLTLDGIAKGFAVDRAVGALRDAGVVSGIVNAGGDLRVFGAQAEPVHVRHPAHPGSLVPIGEIRDAAVATSACYFGNSRFLDPRSGQICFPSRSATVIARDCTTADALTKPLLIDPIAAHSAFEQLGARAVWIPCEAAAA